MEVLNVEKSFKVQIFPNKEQQKLMFKSFGCARFAYNWALNRQKENYENGGKFIQDSELRKAFTKLKKQEEFKWLKEVNNNVCKQAIKDLCKAYKSFFKGISKHPTFKSKKKSKLSYYNDTFQIKFDNYKVRLENVGWVKMAENIIPNNVKYLNPRISYDGIRFWLSIGCVIENVANKLPKTEPIGIDMGVKTLMVCSNGMNFNKVNTKKEKKKLKRLQKRASRYYNKMTKTKSFDKSKNLIKLEALILKQHQRITNIRKNNIHQATTKLVKLNPKAIVVEDLNVKGMMKNKHLSEKIVDCSFYEIYRQLEYKCRWNDIEFIVADRWFASSKICNHCGYKKPKLSLSERVYKCECCGNTIDRDYNASLNLRDLAYN